MAQQTPLFEKHQQAGAKIVDFAGWDMPLHYGSQMDEHHIVRQSAGMFDVSHMCAVDIAGADAQKFLRQLLANDVAKVSAGKAIYSCMLNEAAGVVDDLIVYVLDAFYRVVVNAGTADKDIAWMQSKAAGFQVEISARRDLGILAVQGPQARDKALPLLPEAYRSAAAELSAFQCVGDQNGLIGRTGYTGEDGYECILPIADLPALWDGLIAAGVKPCGLGARDTLRMEAGMNLYGQDMDEEITPLQAGLGWTIAWEHSERDFIGRSALEAQKAAGDLPRFVGLVLEGRGIMRAHQTVLTSAGAGEVTSGGFSPTAGVSIGLARIPKGDFDRVNIQIRNKEVPARVVKAPFVRNGKVLIELPESQS
ncbi:MAG: glycine cleavage system aminomethyltransferase GcvT [Oceanococcus sp.]